MNYEIILTLNEFLKILDDSKYDLKTLKVKNVSAISLTQAFEKKMQDIEKVNVKLQGRIGRFHLEPVRGVTPHFIAHGCCKKCSVKYKFIVKKKPTETERYVHVQIHSSGPHEHDENEKNKQIRGEERERIAKEILIEAGGSCRNYYLQKLELGESPPNEATLRKIKSEFLNCTEITTHDWINELISLTTTLKATLEAEKLLGYIQQITIYRDFSMYLYTEMQLQCLKCLPYKRRILHIDNMDSLVSIPKRFRNQSTILNYFLLLKDTHDLFNIQQYDDSKTLMFSELSSSRYDIYGMTSYLKLLKADYEYLYQLDEDKFSFRLIIIEYSWNMISSCLEVFNAENLETYAQRVFNYSQGMDYEDMSKSWIYVCSTHTMNKFCKSTSKIIDSDYIRLFACFCFSLLLNSYDLSICSQYFELICHVFLSRYSTQLSNSSFNKLQAAIHVRPLIKDEVIKLLNGTDIIDANKNKGVKLNGELLGQQQQSTSSDEYLTSDENEILNFKQIQDQMPFTLHFQAIFEKCFNIVKFESEKQTNYDQNVYYCPQFIQLLIDYYLPYSFLWAGFVLRDVYNPGSTISQPQQQQNNFNVTRLTNSCVRKYSANKKQKGLENVLCLPDKYASDAYKMIKMNCIEFLQQIGSAESDLVRIKISSQLKLNDSTLQLLNGADLSASSANDLDLLDSSVLQTPATITTATSDNNNTIDGTSLTVASAVDIINEDEKEMMITKTTPLKRKASGKYKSSVKSKRLTWSQNKNKKNSKTSSPNKVVDVVDIIVENNQTTSSVATIIQQTAATTMNSDEIGKSKDAQQYIEFIVKGIKITNQNIMDLLEGNSTSDNIVEAYFNCICDKKTFVLSSRSTSELINGTFTGLKRNNLSKFKNIIGATNETNENIWVLIYISVSNASFSYLNPIQMATSKEIDSFKNWKIFAESRKEFATKSWSLKTYEYPLHSDLSISGVFICKYADALIKNDSQNSICLDVDLSNQMVSTRQQIKDVLQKHSDTDFCNYCGYVDCPCISLDMQVWLKCDKCDRRYHLFCATGSNSQQNRPEKFTCLFCDL